MWGAVVNGTRMACMTERDRVPRQQPIVLQITIENVASELVRRFVSVHPLFDYDAAVRGPDLESAALTAEGAALLASDRRMLERRIDRDLEQGESFTEYFYVSDWFQMDRPGEYEVRISRKDDAGKTLTAPPCLIARI